MGALQRLWRGRVGVGGGGWVKDGVGGGRQSAVASRCTVVACGRQYDAPGPTAHRRPPRSE